MSRTGVRGPAHTLAVAHGAFNLVGGLWPLLHLRSFAWVFGPKTDVWLQMTTGGLLASAGAAKSRQPLRRAARRARISPVSSRTRPAMFHAQSYGVTSTP
jgi:hypothetical protein